MKRLAKLFVRKQSPEAPSERPALWLRFAVLSTHLSLTALIAQTLVGLAITVWEGAPIPLENTATASIAGPAAVKTPLAASVDYPTIAEWQLFGKPPAIQHAVATAPPPPTPAAVAPLNLRLVGVFFAEATETYALALIAEGNGVERAYRPGESLPGDAILAKVERDRVIVSQNGRQQVFQLPKRGDAGSLSAAASAQMPPMPTPDPEEAIDPMAGMEEPPPSMPEEMSAPQQPPRPDKRRRFPFHNRGMP